MRLNFFTALIILCFVSCAAKQKTTDAPKNKTADQSYDYVLKNKMLLGKIPITAISKDTVNFKWYKNRYNRYNVKDTLTVKIKPLIDDITFDVYLGTWCPDTKLMLPKFVKILQALDYDVQEVNFYALNKEKQTERKDIKFVPTIIVYQNSKERNRIVERHVKSTEADLLNILTTNTYKNVMVD